MKETDLSLFCTWFANTLIWILCCSGLVFVIAHSQHSSQTSDERVSSGKTKYINSSHVAPSQHCSKNLLLPRSSFAVTLFLLFVVVVMYREISKLTLVFTLQLLNEVVDITWIEIGKKSTHSDRNKEERHIIQKVSMTLHGENAVFYKDVHFCNL